jgi:O-acetyl-ADP-ribose deacetylase (regulator of RNase III)
MNASPGRSVGAVRLTLVQGDITEQNVDAIVNAANSSLLGGGGVDGAIHRRGGPAILEECRAIRRDRLPDGLPPGDAISTTAGRLRAKRVIHTVGPVWHGGSRGEPQTLASAYRNCLAVARDEGLRTIAFPAISTGVFGYPIDRAARTAIDAITAFLEENDGAGFDEIRFVLFSEPDFQTYSGILTE